MTVEGGENRRPLSVLFLLRLSLPFGVDVNSHGYVVNADKLPRDELLSATLSSRLLTVLAGRLTRSETILVALQDLVFDPLDQCLSVVFRDALAKFDIKLFEMSHDVEFSWLINSTCERGVL